MITYVNTIDQDLEVVDIFPNPGKGTFVVTKNRCEILFMELYNAKEEKVSGYMLDTAYSTLSLSEQFPGNYVYKIFTEGGQPISSGKIIIK